MNSNDETKQINNLNNCIMKQFTLKSLMLLLLLLIGGGSYAWGEDLVIDFEKSTSSYSDWTFVNMESMKSDITAHSGSFFGTTGGKKTASIVTKSPVESPKSITFYVSKTSNNTTSSKWLVQTSEDGKKWKALKTQSASSMKKGEWVEVTQDLSSYKNVYVGVYYEGTAAIRAIDDLTLVCSESTNPSLNVNTTSVDFGTVEQNAVIEAKTVSVSLKNVTSANVKLTGEGASAFEVSPAVLAASGDVTITPKTTSVGTYTAKLEISADGAEPQSVDVSMTVREPFDGSVWEIKSEDLKILNGAESSTYAKYRGDQSKLGIIFNVENVLPETGNLQFRKGTGVLYNKTSFSNIVKIELETSTPEIFTVYVGKAEHPEAQTVERTSANGVVTYNFPEGNGYFTIKNNNSKNAGYISSIKVYYSTSPSEPTYTTNTLTFKASNKDGNWATFSNDDVTFFNDDVIVNTVVVENNSLVSLPLDKTTANIGGKEVKGYYVPAKTGVLIYSIGETITYYVVKNKEVAPVDGDFNMLKPASEKMTEGFKFYKLAYDNYTEKTGLGFYWGAAEGGAFTVKPGLAYLAVPQAQAANVKGFSFDGTQTGINGVEATTAKGAIYNLNGQRVEKAQRGIYIQNGKKFIVK